MKSSHRILFAAALTFTALVASPLPAATESAAAAGRALLQRYADAIIGVELVVTLKMKMGDREMPPREQRVEVNGTVISPSGLTVASLAEVDPQTFFETMRGGQQGGNRMELLGVDFKEVKLRLADGTELPARFVLKDADLDLAFMAPAVEAGAAEREFTHVDLGQSAEGAVLADYFYVSRAPKVLQRVPLIRATEIVGVVERPRRLYLMTDQALGTPMLDAAGKVLGISLQHFANNRRTGLVVLPSEDIAEIAKQAAVAQATPSAGADDGAAAPVAEQPAGGS
ncbi:MAG TPA: trypsin-like peptidase domain-containing protein [Opitutus sp.]|nr:trypsin-like peptidase domain-containing protein [Opitutus sp.]